MTKEGALAPWTSNRSKSRQSEKTNTPSDEVNEGSTKTKPKDGLSNGSQTENHTFEVNMPNQSPQTQRHEGTLQNQSTQQTESSLDPPSHQGNQHPQSPQANDTIAAVDI
ncbi:oxytocin receptor [Striga asiatica]|uniref:Oxytocin receptor n=1 Tax=Striga asiatica TaxID=4170 RepID=A0A5A7QFY2_STRAF|nr:oxytocin receptor [Striga asiatica]